MTQWWSRSCFLTLPVLLICCKANWSFFLCRGFFTPSSCQRDVSKLMISLCISNKIDSINNIMQGISEIICYIIIHCILLITIRKFTVNCVGDTIINPFSASVFIHWICEVVFFFLLSLLYVFCSKLSTNATLYSKVL